MTGELIAGRYELEELCGTGGMSSVYRAHDRLLERKVALKILHQQHLEDEEYVERFRREARAVAQLSHPNIVTVIDRGEDAGRQFIVFEFVAGENLKEVVEREGQLPLRQVLELGAETARALAFAHEQGLVHRDVKPQNVLVNGDGRAKVTDFGIARSLDVEKGVTQTGTVLGTSNYIAPEQASGERVDERSDVYSLGVVLYELLTGEVPFPGESFVAVALKHLNEPPPSVLERRPDTPAWLVDLVERALAKDPGERPSMGEIAAALEAGTAGDGAAAPPDATAVIRPQRARPQRRGRSPWPLVLALVGVIALLAAAAAAMRAAGDGEEAPAEPPQQVAVEAVRSHDPYGDDVEHEDRVQYATDGDPSTFWRTERYRYPDGGFGKEGVGIVLRVSGSPSELVVLTDTPGFTAEIREGDRVVSPSRTVEPETVFELEEVETEELILWITDRGEHAAVQIHNVRAR